MPSSQQIAQFQRDIKQFYKQHGRHDLPWRQPLPKGVFDPYVIMVSEIMLQQTQVGRVIPKYQLFLKQFPTVRALAGAPLGEVLAAWSGLGYNRRAQYLHRAAEAIASQYNGVFPQDPAGLTTLPGIGSNTAGAIVAYSFNLPAVFIETNIRSVYLHHFFANQTAVPDSKLLPLIAATLDEQNPREWYWALMDYGSHLKKSSGNAGRRSKHYSRQSVFSGSRRQVRGQVLKLLLAQPQTSTALQDKINDERLEEVLAALEKEGLISQTRGAYRLGK